MEDTWLSLNGINSIIGRGVVIHAGMDDLGKVSIQSSYHISDGGCAVSYTIWDVQGYQQFLGFYRCL